MSDTHVAIVPLVQDARGVYLRSAARAWLRAPLVPVNWPRPLRRRARSPSQRAFQRRPVPSELSDRACAPRPRRGRAASARRRDGCIDSISHGRRVARTAVARLGARSAVADPRLRRANEHGAHARSRAGRRRAVPLPRGHGDVHRLQVLRRRLQRAERQPGVDQLAARRRDRRRMVSRRQPIVLCRWAATTASSRRACRAVRLTPTRRIPITGIVSHSADACIGCQYCTWNCSYGVPQYNPERGVVGKCDMCHGRLSLGQAPACVSACPEGALAIEIVNVAEWRASVDRPPPPSGCPPATAASRRPASRCRTTCLRTPALATSRTSHPNTRTGRSSS